MTEKAFSRWMPLKQKAFEKIPKEPGAYLVRCRNHPTNRLLGLDQEGVLDIGESGNLRRRIKLFQACIEGQKRLHCAGRRFHRLGLARHFPIKELEFKWCITEDKESAMDLEGELLKDYENTFGELPPLNSKSGRG